MSRPSSAPWTVILLAAACAAGERAAGEAAGAGAVEEVVSWLEGTFDNKAQYASDRQVPETVLICVRVPKSRLSEGAPVLYMELADASSPVAPYIQRFYRAEEGDGGRIVLRAFEPKDPIGVRGKWRDPSDLALSGSRDVRERPGCDVTFRKTGDRYEGWTTGTGCPSARNGARYATLSIWVASDRVERLDRGFDVSGKQVWGPAGRALDFRRTVAGAPAAVAAAPPPRRTPVAVPPPPVSTPLVLAPPAPAAVRPEAAPEPTLVITGLGAPRELTAAALRSLGPASGTPELRGVALGDVLARSGLDVLSTEGRRRVAAAVVVALSADGSAVVFSVEELLAQPARVLLAFERDGKPLSGGEGPFRLVDPSSAGRSLTSVVRLEVRFLAAAGAGPGG